MTFFKVGSPVLTQLELIGIISANAGGTARRESGAIYQVMNRVASAD